MSSQVHSYPRFFQVSHPLVASKLTLLRQKKTENPSFKQLVHEISLFIGYEAMRFLPLRSVTIETPLESCEAFCLESPRPVIVPILRAGMGMVDALLSLVPKARVAHMGIFRDEKTLKPQRYYFKMPQKSTDCSYYVCDLLLATGGSAIEAVRALKQEGVRNITLVCLIVTPEGLASFFTQHPDVPLYAAALDRELDARGYIRPGLGDAGDRLFGTL